MLKYNKIDNCITITWMHDFTLNIKSTYSLIGGILMFELLLMSNLTRSLFKVNFIFELDFACEVFPLVANKRHTVI